LGAGTRNVRASKPTGYRWFGGAEMQGMNYVAVQYRHRRFSASTSVVGGNVRRLLWIGNGFPRAATSAANFTR
jgi:hypothetical protein